MEEPGLWWLSSGSLLLDSLMAAKATANREVMDAVSGLVRV